MRLVGTMLLAAGAVMVGLCAISYMDRRVKDLHALISGVECMLRELNYRLAPLPELLAEAGKEVQGRVGQFYLLCGKGAEHLNGRSFSEVWEQAEEAAQLCLEPEDVRILRGLGGVLGRYDGESQCRAMKLTADSLRAELQKAEEQRGRLGKLYGTLGFTAGALIMILLI